MTPREALRAAWKGSDEDLGRAAREHLPPFFAEFDRMAERLRRFDEALAVPDVPMPDLLERSKTWEEKPRGRRGRPGGVLHSGDRA